MPASSPGARQPATRARSTAPSWRLAGELEEEGESLRSVMRALGVGVDRLKLLGGWGAEKLGRLKLNGRLLGYSPLSRVVELDVLALGVTGKLALWRTLELLSDREAALAELDLPGLLAQAERQLEELGELRMTAALDAFG